MDNHDLPRLWQWLIYIYHGQSCFCQMMTMTHLHLSWSPQIMTHLHLPEHYAAVESQHGICVLKESLSRITCKFCGQKMHSAVRMKRHIKWKHPEHVTDVQAKLDVRPAEISIHQCPICKKEFRVKSMLQMHFLKVCFFLQYWT